MTKYDAMQGILRSSGNKTLDSAADYIEELVFIIKMLTSGCESCDFGKISIDAMSRKENGYKFYVIDRTTCNEADIEQIALQEEWASDLCYCDMQGFAILDDGSLILCDECGKYSAALVSDAADAIEKLSQQKTTILLKPNDKRPLHECAACGWYFSDGDVKDFNYCPCCGGKIEKDDETIQDALKEMRTE